MRPSIIFLRPRSARVPSAASCSAPAAEDSCCCSSGRKSTCRCGPRSANSSAYRSSSRCLEAASRFTSLMDSNIRYPYKGEGARGFERFSKTCSHNELVALHRKMLRIRRIEEEIERRYHEDEMKTPIHLVIGQEAAAVGCCGAMQRADSLYLSHRTHGGYLAKGGDLKAMLSEMHCRANGCAGSRGGSMHLIDKDAGVAGTSAIVGGAVPIAAGAALAAQIRKDDRVVVVLIGDATTEEGVCSESMNFAALKQLPMVFFCENNFYSVQSPLAARQPQRDIRRWAEGFGMPAVKVDGMNVLEVYDATAAALDRARGGGPTFIEAPLYR